MARGDVLTVEEEDNEYEQEEGPLPEEHEDYERYQRPKVVAFQNQRPKKPVRTKKLTKKQASTKRKDLFNKLRAGLVKPDVTTDREKERILRRIATKGVVQLFNAVSDRQKTMSDELKKKLSMRERKEAEERLKGNNFDVNGYIQAKAKMDLKGEEEIKTDNEGEEMEEDF